MKGFKCLGISSPSISRSARQITASFLVAFTFAFIGVLPEAVAKPKPPNSINLVPTIQSISVVDGHLVAAGTAKAVLQGKTTTVPFTAPVNIRLAADQSGAGACPILDLSLGPINLDLVGLVVETSEICLQITAYENGGLLGDLLCSVANLLNAGLSLDQILAGLTNSQLDQLLGGLANLFNRGLARLLDAVLTAILPGGGRSCAILHLELGPLNLTLLGLEVLLDNCAGGAVTVDITAETGRGNLLGNLLCGLLGDGLIGLGSTLQAILNQILGLLAF
jgi:hypothetical protein